VGLPGRGRLPRAAGPAAAGSVHVCPTRHLTGRARTPALGSQGTSRRGSPMS
jgi:hypothetical protein